MIRDKDVRLFRIELLEALHSHANATQPEPGARAKECPRINKIVFIHEPRNQQYWGPDNREQRVRHKERPPVMQTAHKTAPPGCARLLGHSLLDVLRPSRQRNLGM